MSETGLPELSLAPEPPKVVKPVIVTTPVLEQERSLLPKAFVDSEYVKRMNARREAGNTLAVLFTDIDGTFFAPGHTASTKQIEKTAEDKNVPLVAITGRNFKQVLERIETPNHPEFNLPYFHVIAGSVGTEIWVLHVDQEGNKTYVRDDEFVEQFADGKYDRVSVAGLSQILIDQNSQLHPEWHLNFQDPESENAFLQGENPEVEPYKVSFNAFLASPQELSDMRQKLEERFVGQKVIISEGDRKDHLTEGRRHYNIDVLPATKADAVNYIRDKTNVEAAFVAGNGGNDTAMLMGSGDISIGVGGSDLEVVEAIQNEAPSRGGRKNFSRSKPGGKIYYIETGERKGPQSILYATKVIERAANIDRIRKAKQQGN